MVNHIKKYGQYVGELIDEVIAADGDPRWAAIAKTELQQGFMALVRSVTKPDFF